MVKYSLDSLFGKKDGPGVECHFIEKSKIDFSFLYVGDKMQTWLF